MATDEAGTADERRYTAALDQILELTVVLNEDMTSTLARDGLTVSRTQVLWVLSASGPSTQRALAEALGVSARTITGLVDGLVATGFVTREQHPTDRRAVLVTFTERGTATAAALVRGQREFALELFADMPAARFGGFVDGLTDVLTRLHELGPSKHPEEGS